MNIEAYRLYCLSKKGVTESMPFPKLPNVLVFKVKGRRVDFIYNSARKED